MIVATPFSKRRRTIPDWPFADDAFSTAIGLVVMAAIPMLQLAAVERLHPFDAQFPAVALRGIVITIIAGLAAMLADLLPDPVALPLLLVIAAAAIWLALRFALPLADRASLGKTARRLRLIGPDDR